MLVSEAAKKLGMSAQTLRIALRQGKFPFGVAIKTSENRYTYYINELHFSNYLKGVPDDEEILRSCRCITDSSDAIGDHD